MSVAQISVFSLNNIFSVLSFKWCDPGVLNRQIHLWNEVVPKLHVFGGVPGQAQWSDVADPLNLMDDCISVGHFSSVCHGGLP